MYDLLIVGAGLTAATLAAALEPYLRVCVLDVRRHLAGNCFDETRQHTLLHRFGPLGGSINEAGLSYEFQVTSKRGRS